MGEHSTWECVQSTPVQMSSFRACACLCKQLRTWCTLCHRGEGQEPTVLCHPAEALLELLMQPLRIVLAKVSPCGAIESLKLMRMWRIFASCSGQARCIPQVPF